MSGLERRVRRLEEGQPPPREPVEVRVRRRILRPTPGGPVEVGQVVRHYRGGTLLEEERRNKSATRPLKDQ